LRTEDKKNMKKKVCVLLLLGIMLTMIFAGCGDDKVGSGNGENRTDASITEDAVLAASQSETQPEASSATSPKETVHEHRFVYTYEVDNIHNVTCADAECEYSESKTCSYDDAYVCEFCGNAHEHAIVYTSNEDGTHHEKCDVCGYGAVVDCVLSEDYICNVCGWSHEHDCVAASNEDSTHTYSCKYNICSYSYVEQCEYSDYECVCGNVYPWEKDIAYFGANEKNIYYAQKELNVYRYPDTGSEVIDTIGIDEEVKCVGSIFYGSGANYERYLVTESGGCIPTAFHQSTSRWDLRIAKTSQVVARCGSDYTIYDSYDAALQSICGYSWSNIKQTWTYNDYKSQGQPFMNTYTKPEAGITVATKDGALPYNCSMNGVEYYFE